MSADISARQPKGIPAGGQFAATVHGEPAVALPAQPPVTQEQFSALMTEELAVKIDASLKGRIRGKDWYSGSRVDQVFEAELDDEGGLSVYTRQPSSDEGVTYAISMADGTARITLNDDYNTGVKPRDLHPELWTGPDDAVREISHVILDMEGGVTEAAASRGETPDGFASDAEYRRWKER
ncbi:hypothetical protein [Pseudarthrobacter chlorophenolicus]|nr:hypothetical protein [Pseudarthrobacter chlorophenolicus]